MTTVGKEFFADAVGYSAGVPVRNLWLLMLYASDFQYQSYGYSGSENVDDNVANLVADVLCFQVEERLKRNLTFGYRYSARDLNRVRGKINILETYSKQLLLKGKINCTFEELSVDTPRNRYISAALDKVSVLNTLSKTQKDHDRARSFAF
jgi:5-methylcytosine-specific restriction enzyme subunit McrC